MTISGYLYFLDIFYAHSKDIHNGSKQTAGLKLKSCSLYDWHFVFWYLICIKCFGLNIIFSSAKMTELFYIDQKWKTYKVTLKHLDRLQQYDTDHMSDSR